MNATKTNRARIDAYRNDATGEIAPPHFIGENSHGRELYAFLEGWTPVAEVSEGVYEPSSRLRCNGNEWWIATR